MREFKVEDFPNIGGVMASKMVVENSYKPRFIFREKPFNENDSGWRIFSGLESDEYSNEPKNFGVYEAKTILKIDDSISNLLLYKGIGSVWERVGETSQWQEVFDYPLEDDFMAEHRLTENWNLNINNLFIRKMEEQTLMYTTGDKTLRFDIWNHNEKSKEELFKEKEQYINELDSQNKIIKIYKFEEENILKIGYHIKEYDEYKDYEYNLICAFCIVDKEVLSCFFYFDDEKDLKWSLQTWQDIKYIK